MTRPDEVRLRRRRVLYLVGILPSLLLLLTSGRIALLLHHQAAALGSYDRADFEESRDHFAANRVLNPVQPWIAPFGEGGARYRSEDYSGAVAAFTVSLQVAPADWECPVRVDLALAEEGLGDESLADGDRQAAEEAWRAGREALVGCVEGEDESAEPAPEGGGDLAQLSDDERLTVARAAAVVVDRRLVRKLGVDGLGPPPGPDSAPPAEPGTRQKEKELEKRDERAQADHVQHRAEFDVDLHPPPTPPPVPQW